MAILSHELKEGNEYIIVNYTNQFNQMNEIYKGIFIQRIPSTGSHIIPIEKRVSFEQWYEIVTIWYSVFSVNDEIKYFVEHDMYYDLNKIKENANKSRQSFEQRTLDLILKRLVNEHFEW